MPCRHQRRRCWVRYLCTACRICSTMTPGRRHEISVWSASSTTTCSELGCSVDARFCWAFCHACSLYTDITVSPQLFAVATVYYIGSQFFNTSRIFTHLSGNDCKTGQNVHPSVRTTESTFSKSWGSNTAGPTLMKLGMCILWVWEENF